MGILYNWGHRMMQCIRKRKYSTVLFGAGTTIDQTADFEGNNKIGNGSTILNTKVGLGSYCGGGCFLKNATIGRYCSIGENVVTICGRHPINFVSTHPAFYSARKQAGFSYVSEEKFCEFQYIDAARQIAVVIGNDVWIGSFVRILEGVSIGDGAVIGAGALVTKNVPPYAVVGGVPAKILRYRFSDDIIRVVNQSNWWNRTVDWVESNADSFCDVEEFIERITQTN